MIEDRNYILYGAGWEAECFLFSHPDIINRIKFCFDRDKTGKFHGMDIRRFDISSIEKNDMILVTAGTKETFRSIKTFLQGFGLKEWEDFIWSKAFRKKVIVINANCYGGMLERYLELSPTFQKKYFIYPIPAIHVNPNEEIEEALLKNTDIFIHQDIRKDYVKRKFSDEYIRSKLSEKCKQDICIPNCVGMGRWMFPNLGNLDKRFQFTNGREEAFFYRDFILDESVKSCCTMKEYIAFFENYQYPAEKLEQLYVEDMEKICSREKNWDIRISDLLKNNYKTEQCFVDHSHLSAALMIKIGRQVAELLQIGDINDDEYHFAQGFEGYHAPIPNCVKQHFGIKRDMECELRSRFAEKSVKMGLEGYIREYLWYYHEIMVA